MQRSLSFFDDEKDLSSSFWKKDSSPTSARDWTPTIGQFFFKKSQKRKGEIRRVYICLFKNYLVTSKTKEWYKKYKSIDLSKHFLIFKRLSETSDGFSEGFSLGYNSKQIELYSKTSEDTNNFVYHLKRYVVQKNFTDMYTTHDKLGNGSYAEVYRIEDKLTHTIYAAKMFRPTALKGSQNAKTVVMNEIIIQRKLDHQHIVKLHEVYEYDGKVVLVLEYAEGRRMLDYVMDNAPLSEKKCILMMKQLLEATIYIHSLGIIHRDIKLENTIITGENETGDTINLKVLDFGLSVNSDNVSFLKKSGTPGYVAPEVFQGESYGQKIDVFSLGVMLYTMLSGKPPFAGIDRRTVLELNKKCEYTLKGKYWSKQSVNAKDLVKKMMEADPTKRLDSKTALEHPWFTMVYLNGIQPVVNIPKVMLMGNKHIFANRPPSPTPSIMNSSIAHHIEPMKKTDSERNLAELRIRGSDKEKSTLDTNRSHSTRNVGRNGQHFNHHFLQIPAQTVNGNPNSQVMLTSVAFDEKMDLSSYDDAINRSSIKTFYKVLSSAHSPKVSSGLASVSSGGVEVSPPKRQRLSTENSGIGDEIARENPDVKDKLSLYAIFEGNRKQSVFMESKSRGLVSLEDIPEAREDKQTCEVTVTNDEDSSRGAYIAVAQTPRYEDVFKVFCPYLKSPDRPRKRALATLKRDKP